MRPNSRYEHVQPFDIDRVAAAADADPDILRMENLDTDLAPPACAVEVTRRAVGEDHANSWLPFTGLPELRQAVAAELERRCGVAYDADAQIVITSGGLSGVIPALFATSDAGDTVVLTDPVYAGLLQRTRLVSARPHLVPLRVSEGVWRIDREALRAAADARPAAGPADQPHRLPLGEGELASWTRTVTSRVLLGVGLALACAGAVLAFTVSPGSGLPMAVMGVIAVLLSGCRVTADRRGLTVSPPVVRLPRLRVPLGRIEEATTQNLDLARPCRKNVGDVLRQEPGRRHAKTPGY